MRNAIRTMTILPAFLLILVSAAHAYERPSAVLLSGEGWQVAPTAPLIDVVENREDRCDWPTLDPALSEVIPAELITGETANALAKYMNRGIIALQWQPIAVPCAWEQVLGIDYNQAGWYRKTVVAGLDPPVGASLDSPNPRSEEGGSKPATTRTWIEFDAISTVAGVWLNGQWLGGNVGDYVRWRVEATDAIRPGENELIVYVDELPDHLTQGFLSMICPHNGGIWQDVRMYETGPVAVSLDGVKVTSSTDGLLEFEFSVEGSQNVAIAPWVWWSEVSPNNSWDSGRVGVDGRFTLETNEPGKLRCHRTLSSSEFRLWSTKDPKVYKAQIQLRSFSSEKPTNFGVLYDTVEVRFAFRSIDVSSSQFLLNGKPLYIRSALNWGYYPRIVAPCPPPDVVREEFRQLKAAGFNAETVCLVNMPDYFYDIADEMGVLIWQEYPSWHCTFAEADRASYERLYERFMARDRNHPSIILRSMSVEAGVQDQSVMDSLYAMGKSMTDTPIQDNNSWFSHSNQATTDWYGEDNYFNNPQWERHLMGRLPRQLDALPAKPYLIGESILFNTWPDVQALEDCIFAKHVPLERGAMVRSSGVERKNTEHGSALQSGEDTDHGSALQSGENTGDGSVLQPTMAWIKVPGPWGLSGTDQPSKLAAIAPQGGPGAGEGGGWPYWFPRCMDSVIETEAKLRERHNASLPEGQDIIRDYLLPQSYDYAMQSRRFQMELMHADPRYAGYTVNCIRDMPLIRAGLLDDLGRPRWTPEQWAWHGDRTDSPVHVGDYDPLERKPGEAGRLDSWDPQWTKALNDWTLFPSSEVQGRFGESDRHEAEPPHLFRRPGITVLRGGYQDIVAVFRDWNRVNWLEAEEVTAMPGGSLIVTSVLTHDLVDLAARGGKVILLASKWPGGFGSEAHMHWRDAVLVPPAGPAVPNDETLAGVGGVKLSPARPGPRLDELLRNMQCYDMIRDYSQVIPVGRSGIAEEVDPLLRLFDTHDLDHVEIYDQLFATKVGQGVLVVSSLDHTSAAGQDVLDYLVSWFGGYPGDQYVLLYGQWLSPMSKYIVAEGSFPATSMSPERLHEFAVKRANGILGLDSGWFFRLDPKAEGEAAGWMNPLVGASATAEAMTADGWEARTLPAWWEQWGINYDGMAWYRTTVDAPADWADATVRLICDGVDDGYVVWVNGQRVALHGSFTDHEATVFQKQTVTDITQYLKPGEQNTIALQVVDIVGNGGIWKPVYITAD